MRTSNTQQHSPPISLRGPRTTSILRKIEIFGQTNRQALIRLKVLEANETHGEPIILQRPDEETNVYGHGHRIGDTVSAKVDSKEILLQDAPDQKSWLRDNDQAALCSESVTKIPKPQSKPPPPRYSARLVVARTLPEKHAWSKHENSFEATKSADHKIRNEREGEGRRSNVSQIAPGGLVKSLLTFSQMVSNAGQVSSAPKSERIVGKEAEWDAAPKSSKRLRLWEKAVQLDAVPKDEPVYTGDHVFPGVAHDLQDTMGLKPSPDPNFVSPKKVPKQPSTFPPHLVAKADRLDAVPKSEGSHLSPEVAENLQDAMGLKASPGHDFVIPKRVPPKQPSTVPPHLVAKAERLDVVAKSAESHRLWGKATQLDAVAKVTPKLPKPVYTGSHVFPGVADDLQDTMGPKPSPEHDFVTPNKVPKQPSTLPPHLVAKAERLDAVPKSAVSHLSPEVAENSQDTMGLKATPEHDFVIPKRVPPKQPSTLPPHLVAKAERLDVEPNNVFHLSPGAANDLHDAMGHASIRIPIQAAKPVLPDASLITWCQRGEVGAIPGACSGGEHTGLWKDDVGTASSGKVYCARCWNEFEDIFESVRPRTRSQSNDSIQRPE